MGQFWILAQKIFETSVITFQQGRSQQTFSFGGATGGASFATRGAVNGLCRTFRKRPTPGAWAPPRSAPAFQAFIVIFPWFSTIWKKARHNRLDWLCVAYLARPEYPSRHPEYPSRHSEYPSRFFSYAICGLGREVFTKLRFSCAQKSLGTAAITPHKSLPGHCFRSGFAWSLLTGENQLQQMLD